MPSDLALALYKILLANSSTLIARVPADTDREDAVGEHGFRQQNLDNRCTLRIDRGGFVG